MGRLRHRYASADAQLGPYKSDLVYRIERSDPEPGTTDPLSQDDIMLPSPQAMNEFSKLLSRPQIIAAAALANGATTVHAAKIADVGVSLVRAWKKRNIPFTALIQHITSAYLGEARVEASRILLSKLKYFRNGRAEMGESPIEWVRLALYMTSTKMNPHVATTQLSPEQLHQHVHLHGELPSAIPGMPPNTAMDPQSLLNLQNETRKLNGNERRGIADLLRPREGTPVAIPESTAIPVNPDGTAIQSMAVAASLPTQSEAPKKKQGRRKQQETS